MSLGWICFGVTAAACLGLIVRNQILSAERDEYRESVHELSKDNEAYKQKVERLLDDVTTLAKQVPKHGANGRFVKRG